MPFIITTKKGEKYYADPYPDDLDGPDPHPVAVATLDEARGYAVNVWYAAEPGDRDEHSLARRDACLRIPESGGTIGPLPDGTTIEVERVEPSVLGLRAGLIPADHPSLWPVADLVRVFNREHAPA
jgi:hypothetical protein